MSAGMSAGFGTGFDTKIRLKAFLGGWRGICLVAITYVYFLIFAQFAFLKRLAALGIAGDHLKIVMAAMAAGGILCSLLSGSPAFARLPRLRLQLALCTCSVTALLTLHRLDLTGAVALSFLIGAGLGVLTVTLVSNLGLWLGSGSELLKVGVGTGLGYFLCNYPPLFTATPSVQAIAAAALCLLGVFAAANRTVAPPFHSPGTSAKPLSFSRVLVGFTALVWLDSAAFFIIQNTPSLKAGTWGGALHLWMNALLHLSAAVAAAVLLRRKGLSFVLGGALLALACACLLLLEPRLDPRRVLLASVFYPVGVSLYSVALVAYPSLLAPASSPQDRARKAGGIYAVAGWFGSAMGIGMGQHLGQVPVAFVLLASALVLGPHMLAFVRTHKREAGATAAVSVAALCIHAAMRASAPQNVSVSQNVSRNVSSGAPPPASSVERGRQVYISEGCINCHSQYVRPGTADVLMWGPSETVEELHSQRPPLIGNRRQGPDLSQVGGRRSALWLKIHFYDPRQLNPASFMPSYAYLFQRSTHGDDLIAYLRSLKSPAYAKHIQAEGAWQPSAPRAPEPVPDAGAHLFTAYCATCHAQNGATRLGWMNSFTRTPPNLQTGMSLRLAPSATSGERELRLARIVKFGIPGTDMPGHEYLPDGDVRSLAVWLNQNMMQPTQVASARNSPRNSQGSTR